MESALAGLNLNLKPDALSRLVAQYPSHSFVIDRDEAQSLFQTVRAPSEFEEALGEHLFELMLARVGERTPLLQFLTEECAPTGDRVEETTDVEKISGASSESAEGAAAEGIEDHREHGAGDPRKSRDRPAVSVIRAGGESG
jgi:hypothetical protein